MFLAIGETGSPLGPVAVAASMGRPVSIGDKRILRTLAETGIGSRLDSFISALAFSIARS